MKIKHSRLTYLIAVCGILLHATNLNGQTRNYRLVWEDNFDGKVINTEHWTKIARTKAQWACHMSDHSSLYDLKKGRLRLYARVNKGIVKSDTAKYLTGGITSREKMYVRYGKVEARVRVHGAQGTWPAIWMSRNKRVGYPKYAELDLMELLNHNTYVYQTVHNNWVDKLKMKTPAYQVKADINPENYNVYAVEILPNEIIFSVNGKETLHYPKIQTDQEGQFPYGEDNMFVMLDMQVGGAWVKTVDPKQFPAYMDIDWVRMYEYEGERQLFHIGN